MTEVTDQQKICIKCQWCCRVKTLPLGCANKAQMKLWLLQGLDVFYNHDLRSWTALIKDHPCPHLDEETGCRIYDSPEKHKTCSEYLCAKPDGSFPEFMDEACKAGRKFLLDQFEKEDKHDDI